MPSKSIYTPISCSCIQCRKEITTSDLKNHMHYNHQHLYPKNPTFTGICPQCNCEFRRYAKTKFCSHVCSAKFHNTGKTVSNETKRKISKSLTLQHSKIFYCTHCNKIHQDELNSEGCCSTMKLIMSSTFPHSKVCLCTCKHCKVKFTSRTQLQYCKNCREFSANKRIQYAFKFNVYDYPDLFNLHLLTEVGFYGPNGKSGKWNPHGLSRDHKISVSDAIKNKYDPYYITHPLNCEIMPHTENNKKKTNSSITYEELVSSVDKYDLVRVVGFEPTVFTTRDQIYSLVMHTP